MRRIAFDTETYPFVTAGKATMLPVPKPVCLSWYDGEDGGLVKRDEACRLFGSWITDPDVELIGHNLVFDLNVMIEACETDYGTDVRDAIRDGRCHDTILREQLVDIARGGIFTRGGYGLDQLVKRHLGETVAGKSGAGVWRLRYNELDDVPLDEWPDDAYEYALLDAQYTYRVWAAQADKYGSRIRKHQADFQLGADWMTSLISAWGLMVDEEFAELVDAHYAKQEHAAADVLREAGIMRENGTMSMKAKRKAVAEAWKKAGTEPIRTKTGLVSTSKSTIRELDNEYDIQDPAFEAIIDYEQATSYRASWLDPILSVQGGPLCTRYDALKNTGRVSSSKPPLQNVPARLGFDEQFVIKWWNENNPDGSQIDRVRDGVVVKSDIRGCFAPRPGKVFIAADYSSIELAGLAQVLKNARGELTDLGQAINTGQDLHCRLGAQLSGCSYEEFCDAYDDGESWAVIARTVSKIMNYSAPVGARTETIAGQGADQGARFAMETWKRAHRAWRDAWGAMGWYLDEYIPSFQSSYGGPYWIEQHGPDGMTSGWRLRMCEKLTEAANTPFQGITGDGAKWAGWLLMNECYFETDSVLYGARPVLFVHDEYVLEVDEDRPHECGAALSDTMVEGMSKFIPDIHVEAEYEILETRWKK